VNFETDGKIMKHSARFVFRIAALLATGLYAGRATRADINGLEGSDFRLTASAGTIVMPDGLSVHVWGFGPTDGNMQYPGPTLITTQGQLTQITLLNELPEPTSMVFPGMVNVVADGGVGTQQGLLALEALPGGTVSYSFTPRQPGTYLYYSGTRPDVQVEMGLLGALIVRPMDFDPLAPRAYQDNETAYDQEYLFLLSEMDPRIHEVVLRLGSAGLDGLDYLTDHQPQYWFINGRVGPDTFLPNNVPWLKHQPYGAMARTHPGERMLMRVVGGGRDVHPFHHHGNHARVIAKNGRLGTSASYEVFTIQTAPGETIDAIWTWTGQRLGWDAYGHAPGDPLEPGEYAPDHGKPIPVNLTELQDLAFGGFYSGDPFLGSLKSLPPGEGGLNQNGGFHFMWHSHTEKELVNNDIAPGGMMTMCIVEPHGVPID
jgi:FtsP/CotA-like multicopper oxidase with cupredoxin domain